MSIWDMYPYTDFEHQNLDWILGKVRELIAEFNKLNQNFNSLEEKFDALKKYIEDYFDDLDVQDEINNKLDELFEDGTLWQMIADYLNNFMPVNVLEYGAKGDGETDDTEAFQAALDTGYDVYIPQDKGQHYRITNTLNITKKRQCIYSDPIERLSDETVSLNDQIGFISFEAETANSILFYVDNVTGIRFQNLTIKSANYNVDNNYIGVAFYINATNLKDNADAQIFGGAYFGFNRIVVNYGRGTALKNNHIFHFNRAYEQHYTFDGYGAYDVQQPEWGDRACIITNNRFHSGNWIFQNVEGKLTGALFTNNVSDGGAGFMEHLNTSGGMKDSLIANNSCPIWNRQQFIYLNGGEFTRNIIAGNTIDSLPAMANPNRWLQVTPNVTNFSFNIIDGNIVGKSRSDCIFIEATIIEGNSIVNNVFYNTCQTASNSIAPIRFKKAAPKNIVSFNVLYVDLNTSISPAPVIWEAEHEGSVEQHNVTNIT